MSWVKVMVFLFLCLTSSPLLAIKALKPDQFSKYQNRAKQYENVCLISVGDVNLTGTLIAPEFVLTCAHGLSDYCKKGVPTSLAEPGVCLFSRKVHKNVKHEDRYLTDLILIHEDYNAKECENDIALIRLDRPVEGIAPMPLSTLKISKEIRETLKKGKKLDCHLVGYGHQTHDPKTQRLAADARQVSRLKNAFSKNSFGMPRKKLGGAPGTLTPGDSGGPLIYKGHQIGVNVGTGGYVVHAAGAIDPKPGQLFDIACSVIDLKGSSWEKGIKTMFETLGLDHKAIGKKFPESNLIKTYSDTFASTLLTVIHASVSMANQHLAKVSIEFNDGMATYRIVLSPAFLQGYINSVITTRMLPPHTHPGFDASLAHYRAQGDLQSQFVSGHTHELLIHKTLKLPFTLCKLTR